MKKILLILSAILLFGASAQSQVATASLQAVGNKTLDSLKKSQTDITYTHGLLYKTEQVRLGVQYLPAIDVSTAFLPVMKQKSDTANTRLREISFKLSSPLTFTSPAGSSTKLSNDTARTYDRLKIALLTAAQNTAVATYTAQNLASNTSTNILQAVSDKSVTGTLSTINSVVQINLNGSSVVAIQISGAWSGSNITLQGTLDGTTWVTLGQNGFPMQDATSFYVASTPIGPGFTGILKINVSGLKSFRLINLVALTGTANIVLNATSGAGLVGLDSQLPRGSNLIGNVQLQDQLVTGNITTQNLNATGVGTAGSFVGYTNLNGAGSCLIQVTGTASSPLSVQISLDGVNWITDTWNTNALTNIINGVGAGVISTTGVIIEAKVNSAKYFRVVALSAFTGPATITINVSATTGLVALSGQLPAGANSIGYLSGVGGSSGISPGNSSNNLGKSEDGVHSSADLGVMALAQQNSGLTANNANLDYTQLITDDLSKLIVMPYTHLTNAKQAVTSAIITTTDTQLFPAVAAVRTYVTSLTIVNTSATASLIEVKDNVTVIWRGYAPANGSTTYTYPTPLKGTANTIMNVACTTTAANVYVSATGFNAL